MIENRKHIRFEPIGLPAVIAICPPPPHEKILLEGVVVDMSYSGIKIKLSSVMPTDIPESKVEIHLRVPKSAFPIAIKGVIRHVSAHSEWGLKFSEEHPEEEVDNLLFECMKMTSPTQSLAAKH